MRLLLDRCFVALSDRYVIFDEQWNVRYYVYPEMFSFVDKLRVFNANRYEVASISQSFMSCTQPKYRMIVDGERIGTVKKKFSFLNTKYGIEYNDWRLEGDPFMWDYCVYSGDRVAVRVSRTPEAFVIDIDNPAEEKAGILVVIATTKIERRESICVS